MKKYYAVKRSIINNSYKPIEIPFQDKRQAEQFILGQKMLGLNPLSEVWSLEERDHFDWNENIGNTLVTGFMILVALITFFAC